MRKRRCDPIVLPVAVIRGLRCVRDMPLHVCLIMPTRAVGVCSLVALSATAATAAAFAPRAGYSMHRGDAMHVVTAVKHTL